MKKICVIGSLNIDHIFYVDHLTQPGETQRASGYEMYYGGKGGNQAVACRLLGLEVSMVGAINLNDAGKAYLSFLKHIGIKTDLIVESTSATGMAFIEVDQYGENKITTWGGANYKLKKSWFEEHINHILSHDIFMFSLEIPKEIIEYLMPILIEHQKIVILDPGPVKNFTDKMLYDGMIVTPNNIEYAYIKDNFKAHTLTVIQKEGHRGSTFTQGDLIYHEDAFLVDVIDTVGAGDTFNAGVAYAIAHQFKPEEILIFANGCGALATTKKGAQNGMPTEEQVKALIHNRINDQIE
ncbi:MAG: ribokinase [Clostridia bacterium]|nr:ribokinase [Clostridia bacterium]